MEEIAKCPEALAVASEAIQLTMKMKATTDKWVLDMVKVMNLEKMMEIAGQ